MNSNIEKLLSRTIWAVYAIMFTLLPFNQPVKSVELTKSSTDDSHHLENTSKNTNLKQFNIKALLAELSIQLTQKSSSEDKKTKTPYPSPSPSCNPNDPKSCSPSCKPNDPKNCKKKE